MVMGEGGTEESSSSVVRWAALDVLPPLRVLRTDCFRRCGRCLRTSVPFLVSIDMTTVSLSSPRPAGVRGASRHHGERR